MLPTIRQGDRVAIATKFDTIERADVIALHSPAVPDPGVKLAGNSDEVFKRVIGLPGDVVEWRGGQVFVNGKQLAEPYLRVGMQIDSFATVTVTADHHFVPGDNRPNSAHSRMWG